MDISRLSDEELWARTRQLARDERAALCDFVEHLAELDERRLHQAHELPTLFDYCVHYLRLPEGAAYRRIRAARAIKIFTPVGPMLRDGRLSVETIALLHPYLKDDDAAALVTSASGKKTWEVQRLIASRKGPAPRQDVIRHLAPPEPIAAGPTLKFPLSATEERPAPSGASEAPVCPAATEPPATPAVVPKKAIRFAFTADEEFYSLLIRARALTRRVCPDGRLEGVLKAALRALLRKKDPLFERGP